MQTRLIRNRKELKGIRSRLRRRMTAPEVIIWQKLRRGQLGIRFRRQYSVENNILDFYSPAVNLGIEIDGESHYDSPEASLKDQIRDQKLAEHGIKVLRFTNREVMDNLAGVIEKIILELPPLNLPLNKGEKSRGSSSEDKEKTKRNI